MGKSSRDTNTRKDEAAIRVLERAFARAGITVRREKLSCGTAYRTKSGSCFVSGQQMLFVDRRLAPDQQLSVLVDYVLQLEVELVKSEQDALPQATRELIVSRQANIAGGLEGDDDDSQSPEAIVIDDGTPERAAVAHV